MQRHLTAAGIAAVCFTMIAPRLASAQGPSACPVPTLLKDVPNVRVREGDQATVKVTGRKPPSSGSPSPVPTKTPTILLMVPPGAQSVTVKTTSKKTYSLSVPASSAPNGFVLGALPPPASPTASPSPSPAPTTPTNGSVGAPADKLSADVNDPYVATIATAEPAPGHDAAGEEVPSVTYTLKGQHSGNTRLVVSQGTECVAVDVLVRPPKERFLATTGLGLSHLPKNTFTTVTVPVPDASSLPAPNPPPGIYVYRTESSATQTSIPILASYRLNDAPNVDLYATIGYFASSDANGPVFGVSAGSRQLLFTFGVHSGLMTDFSPYVNQSNNRLEYNGAATFAALPTTTLTRRRQLFFAVTVPASLITGVLPGNSPANK